MMIRILLAALLLFMGITGWSLLATHQAQAARDASEARAVAAESRADSLQSTLTAERMHATRMAEIAAQHEKARTDEKAASDQLVADLRADQRRLRTHWQAALATSDLSRAVAAAAFPDGGAELRQRDLGAIRGIVGRCQAQVIGLQDVVRACPAR